MRVPIILAGCVGLSLLLASTSLHAGGGAWVRSAKGYYFKVGFLSTTAEKERGFSGEERPLFRDTARFGNGRIGISNIVLYNEYGLTDWFTTLLSTQYTVVVREADILEPGMEGLTETESASGLGDIWVGGRVRLFPNDWKLAGGVSLQVKIPTGSPNKEVPLGTGVFDYEGGVGLGLPFMIGTHEGYTQTSGGYRLRNMAADEFFWQVETGFDIIPTLKLQATFDGITSTADFEEAAEQSGANDLIFDELVGSQTFARFSGGLVYEPSNYMELSAFFAGTVAGVNTLDARVFSVGVAWKL